LKMKMAIILGVIHMTCGIILSAINHYYEKEWVGVWGEFIPQILFLLGLFGYLSIIIIFKWLQPWNTQAPPLLLNTLINMFLKPYEIPDGQQLYSGQLVVQNVLLVMCIICVPVMLLSKPYYLKHEHRVHQEQLAIMQDHKEEHEEGTEAKQPHHEETFDFGEIFVKQIIHTIEFVLGAVSNTASYLRLWALSLAHAQLSDVFWERVLIGIGFDYGNPFLLFICFGVWFGATIGVLMIMESLSAFLHALRLHWVEFQNKFYKGDGKLFTPFSYETILYGGGDDDK